MLKGNYVEREMKKKSLNTTGLEKPWQSAVIA
jgi:hypothetical protein